MLANLQAPPSGAKVTPVDDLSAWALRRRRHVLVVDDSQTYRLVLGALLEKVGFSVELADGGEAAVAAVASTDADSLPDAVLMDVSMPHTDGIAATRRIREMPAPHNGVVIVGVSGNTHPEDRERGLAAGMNDFILKPAGRIQLLTVLRRLIV